MNKIFILLALLLLSCEKPPAEEPITTGTVTFWTTEPNPWVLYVDGKRIGIINEGLSPVCGDTRFTTLHLRPGLHQFYLYLFIPAQPWPNMFTGETYNFNVTLGGCTVIRAKQ